MTRIHNRKITEDEDKVLDRLWKEISDQPSEFNPCDADFQDICRRIDAAKKRKRKIVTIFSAAGAAAVLTIAVCLPFRHAEDSTDTPATRLKSMGIAVSDEQVALRMDNDISLSLTDSASFKIDSDKETSVVNSSGIEIEVGSERILRLEVPSGKQFHLRLADGTSVWLNAESSIEYPASFDDKTSRTVKLVGEAFFDVTRDESKPFIVELADGGSIRVLGTSFNVNAYPDNDKEVTTLLSGKISYRQDASGEEMTLLPDQQISVDRSDGKAEIQNVESSASADWKGRMITFDNESLPSLAKRLSRMYGIEIIVGEHLSDYAFSGRISYDKGVDFITGLMKETSGISCEIKDGKIFLN